MVPILLVAAVILLAVGTALLIALLRRKTPIDLSPVQQGLQASEERTQRAVREEMARNRQELGNALKGVGDSLNQQLGTLAQANDRKLEMLRITVEEKLKAIQENNARQLEQMRQTVDEKLQGTLEKRLGESFKQVSERLEAVYKGLGEMQTLAVGVGDLKRVLTNVKTRGTWGEVQLGALLAEVLAADQYAVNVATKPGSAERVEFAVKLPGRGADAAETVWMPIDAKFPIEDYQRLVDAQERVDVEAVEAAGKQLESRVRACAKDICEKYLNPPQTTDFAILFMPIEGLFAEVIRRSGLAEGVQRQFRVVLAGPTTLWAVLNSLQMGFRTLAIEKRSSEVWKVLGNVKTEFGNFGLLLDGVKEKLDQASNKIDLAARKSRTIERKLRGVEELPAAGDGQADLPQT